VSPSAIPTSSGAGRRTASTTDRRAALVLADPSSPVHPPYSERPFMPSNPV
jgi:hypothetical protein